LWKQADFSAISAYLSNYSWYDFVQHHSNAESMREAFIAVLHHAIDLFVPSVVHCNKNNVERKRYSRDIRRALARKRSMWRKCKANNKNIQLLSQYKKMLFGL